MTTSELTHWMAIFKIYGPLGEEAMDARFGRLVAKLEAGVGVVQMKRSKSVKIKEMFKRDFWTRPHSTKALRKKLMKMFGVDDEENNG